MSKFDYKKWYNENKDKISEKRKQRYQKDKEYREEARINAKYHYWENVRDIDIARKIPLEDVEITEKPYGVVKIRIEDENDVRYGEEVEVNVYTSGSLAKMMGRTDQTIRLWEQRGIYPPQELRNSKGYRLFTEHQVKIFLSNKPLLGYSIKNFENSVFAKELNKDFAKLSNGVLVIPKQGGQ